MILILDFIINYNHSVLTEHLLQQYNVWQVYTTLSTYDKVPEYYETPTGDGNIGSCGKTRATGPLIANVRRQHPRTTNLTNEA